MNFIVACDKNLGIGYDNELLYHISQDLKHFKELTTGKVVVMGKNTLLSLPNSKPLPNRVNIVLSSTLKAQENIIVAKNLNELFKILSNYNSEDIFVIGGAQVYEQLYDYCDTGYITVIDGKKRANKFFPRKIWEDKSSSNVLFDEKTGLYYKFKIVLNKNVKKIPTEEITKNEQSRL